MCRTERFKAGLFCNSDAWRNVERSVAERGLEQSGFVQELTLINRSLFHLVPRQQFSLEMTNQHNLCFLYCFQIRGKSGLLSNVFFRVALTRIFLPTGLRPSGSFSCLSFRPDSDLVTGSHLRARVGVPVACPYPVSTANTGSQGLQVRLEAGLPKQW